MIRRVTHGKQIKGSIQAGLRDVKEKRGSIHLMVVIIDIVATAGSGQGTRKISKMNLLHCMN